MVHSQKEKKLPWKNKTKRNLLKKYLKWQWTSFYAEQPPCNAAIQQWNCELPKLSPKGKKKKKEGKEAEMVLANIDKVVD